MRTRTALLALAVAAVTPLAAQQTRHTYVLVHGAWGGGWAYRHVDSLLTAAGHRVYRPTLSGLGERVHLATPERLLQGPFADAMTHVGQIAMLRRLFGAPVPPENFIVADIDAARLGPAQPEPRGPDEHWPEAPPGWTPPARK